MYHRGTGARCSARRGMLMSSGCNGRKRVFEVVVCCANSLAYAEKALVRGGDIEDVPWNAWGTARDERVG